MRNILSFMALMVLLISCGEKSKVKYVRLAHGLPTTHPVHEAMVYMGERLKEKSEGKLMLKIYPSSQLGSERECLELLQIGSLDITKVSSAVLENFDERFKVFGLPYLFRDKEHRFQVLDGEVGEELLSGAEKVYLKGLCFYDAGSRSFYTVSKPIKNPTDLDGLKIRVMKSNTAIQMVEKMGGSPTPISFGELYSALQQNVVDGAENNPPSFYTSKHYEVCKHYTLDEHASIPDVLVIGTKTWKKLSDSEQKMIMEAAEESALHQRVLWEKFEKKSLDELKKAGVKIIVPDKKPFSEKTSSMFTEEALGEEVFKIYQRITKI